ncbi:MAG: hypothetical protein PHN88_03060 [Ignavibacteria bacterium]|nr:hypothetical protein [Ignavibacteria bacterium]
MRTLYLALFFILFTAASRAQSPEYVFKFRLEELVSHGDTCSSEYKIDLVQYENKNTDILANPFGHDSSKYDWSKFNERKDLDFKRSVICTASKTTYTMNFKASNQGYIFDNYYEIQITRNKCGKTESMIIRFPIRVSSFVTFVTFIPIYFIPGDFNIDIDIDYTFDNTSYLNLSLPKDYWIGK